MTDPPNDRQSTELLDALEQAFLAAHSSPGRLTAIDPARASAETLGAKDDAAGRNLSAVVFLAKALAASALEVRWSTDEFRKLVEVCSRVSGLSRDVLSTATYVLLVRDPDLLQLPPQASLDTQLRFLCLFTGAEGASVWEASPASGVQCIASTADEGRDSSAAAEARRVISTDVDEQRGPVRFHGIAVAQWPQPHAALVVHADPARRDRILALAKETASVLSVILERDALVKRGAGREQSLVALTERRFARLGFDLHDGPLQDVAALAGELRHFRKQLPRLLDAGQPLELTVGRVDDIEARLVALDRDLRDLARSFESPAVLGKSFVEAIRAEVEAVSRSSRIQATAHLEGDFERLTNSQRIALFRIVQEALANVRAHSGATTVSVSIATRDGQVELEIIDDGRGFDVETRLIKAARRGHLGVVGMNERVRLLGGAFALQSQKGGPTKISVSLPAWQPLARGGESDPSGEVADLA